MIRRFAYHLFWNFYDYLGTNLFLGAAFSLTLLLAITGLGPVVGGIESSAGRVAILVAITTLMLLVGAAALAGFMPFALHAARDHTPRLPDFWRWLQEHLKRYARLLLLVGIVAVVLAANLVFYWRLSTTGKGALSYIGTIAGAAFFWLTVALSAYVAILLAVAGDGGSLKQAARRAFMAMALTPGLWLVAMITLLGGIALCLLSRVGVVFVIPWFATVTGTAYRIVEQHAAYLAEAREALGDGQSIAAYRRKAIELAWNWEYRQPRRTLRELIKPWEY